MCENKTFSKFNTDIYLNRELTQIGQTMKSTDDFGTRRLTFDILLFRSRKSTFKFFNESDNLRIMNSSMLQHHAISYQVNE